MLESREAIEPGTVFGRLTVIGIAPRSETTKRLGRNYSCRCECGNITVARGDTLKAGKKKSCGCLQADACPLANRSHGESGSKLYMVRNNLISRCCVPNNPGYPNYGGRGITVCREWLDSYEAFAAWARANGYVEGLDIDRIDNNAGYSPDNCRWVTRGVNLRNRRNNYLFTAFGETKCLTDWAIDQRCEVSVKTLKHRIKQGLDPDDVISRPSQQGKILNS
jgi:hypothetical protein